MTQPITQRSFIKGLDASTTKFDQPRGSLPRLSNLVLTRRGSLITSDGTLTFGSGALSPSNNSNGPIIDIVQYNSPSAPSGYSGSLLYLQGPKTDFSEALPDPVGVVLTGVNVGGGTLIPGNTYSYHIQTSDGVGNSSGASGPFSLLLPGGMNAIQITFNAVWGAGSYNIFGRSGGVFALINPSPVLQPDFSQNSGGPIGGPTATFTDTGGALGAPIFGVNTSVGPLKLFVMTAMNSVVYNAPVLIAKFPTGLPPGPFLQGPTTSGGVPGATSVTARMRQFSGKIVIALGNGYRAQSTDGITTAPFTNTFTALYVIWTASTTYLVGDIIKPLTPNGHIFKCVQGGQTAVAEPAWQTGSGQTTIDNQVQWVENGFLTNSPAPPAAAHAITHAGSLWCFNTNPTNTTDGLDGPSSLRMSDSNNLSSWNPLNQAFIGKDDGSDGMGLASFTIAELGISPLGSLVLFKDFSTYQIVGVFGAQDFTIQQIQSDMGCLAPKSIKFVSGYGVVRFCHLGFALFDGIRDKLISEQIRPYIFGSPSTGSPGLPAIQGIDITRLAIIHADLINVPPIYACAAPLPGSNGLIRIFMYDLVLKAWTIIDIPTHGNPSDDIMCIYQLRGNELFPVTVVGGWNNGSIQYIQNGNSTWELNIASEVVKWAFTTPEVFNTADPSAEIYVSNVLLRGINLDGFDITVTVNIQTESGIIEDTRVYNIGNGEFQLMIGVNEQALSFNATISGTGRVEIESLTWNVAPKPSGIPAVLT